MAKRKFELPGIQELSKEQEAARALPKEGQHLIVGGPGTGKSILALIRARRYHREQDEYLFLVFNHILNRANKQLFGKDLVSETWTVGSGKCSGGSSASRFLSCHRTRMAIEHVDWEGVERIVDALPSPDSGQPFLVLDEGQDMPPQFYDSLVGLGFENFFVVADQNQQIRDENSSRKDIEDGLVIDSSDVIELHQNFRNNHQVARLARAFYTGDPASPPPELPSPAAGSVPLLYSYAPDGLAGVAQGIVRLADRDPRELIGVIAPNNFVRERYLDALRSVDVPLDNPRPPIETFHMGNYNDVSFDEGGILVINAQACKGIEFDTAILADINEHYFRRDDPDATRRLFYVMVARARERVFMFMKRGDHSSAIENILPTDTEILRREDR